MASVTNGRANGKASHDGDPRISRPTDFRNVRPNPLDQINAGGIGLPPGFAEMPKLYDTRFEKQYLPGQSKSLSGIALRAFILGQVLSASLITTAIILIFTSSPLWRLSFFLSSLSAFHFLEFWTTARYNTPAAQISSFLLSQNGSAYNIAHTAAMVECLARNLLFPDRSWVPQSITNISVIIGLALIAMGQMVRSAAMIEAGTNFNHVVQYEKSNQHRLVTSGIYGYLRHPSYFGFFYWAIGTEMVLCNPICFIGYIVVLWRFFSRRISGEEALLIKFFGEEYLNFRLRTRVGIPFIR